MANWLALPVSMGKGDGVQSSAPRASFRGLFPLLAAGVLGRIPFVALPIASLLFVADKTSLTRGGLASGAVSFGAGVVGVVVGRALDAGHTKVVLVSLAVAHVPAVAAFIALADTPNRWLLGAVSLAAGATLPPLGPVVRAALAQSTDRLQARQVFAYEAMSVEVTWIGGPLLVSVAVLLNGNALAVAMSPVLVLLGVGAVLRQPTQPSAHPNLKGRWLTRPVVQLVVAFSLLGAGFRAVTIAVAEVARLDGNPEASGVLLAIWAIGSLLGGWVAARRPLPAVPLLGLAVAISLGLIGVGSTNLWLTGVLVLVSGLPTAPFISGINALVSTAAEDSAHARAFAAMQAGATVTSAAGAAVGGAVIEKYGPAVVSVPSGILLALAAGLTALAAVGEQRRHPEPATLGSAGPANQVAQPRDF